MSLFLRRFPSKLVLLYQQAQFTTLIEVITGSLRSHVKQEQISYILSFLYFLFTFFRKNTLSMKVAEAPSKTKYIILQKHA